MFRKAILQDCKEIYALVCSLEDKQLSHEKFLLIYQQQIENKNYYCLVLEKEKRIIAILNLRFEYQLHHAERIAEIMEFSVDASYRNHGLGREMFAKACQIAKEHGCVQIEVACNQLRSQAHRFYLREGMNNFHYKFSKSLVTNDIKENKLGF